MTHVYHWETAPCPRHGWRDRVLYYTTDGVTRHARVSRVGPRKWRVTVPGRTRYTRDFDRLARAERYALRYAREKAAAVAAGGGTVCGIPL